MKINQILRVTQEKMQGKWQLALRVTVVVAAITMIVPATLTPALGGLGGIADLIWLLVVTSPVSTGAMWLFLDIHDGQQTGVLNHIFDPFYDLSRMVKAWSWKYLLVVFQMLFFVIPGLLALVRYSQMEFILKDHPMISGQDALKKSKEMMRGNQIRYLGLYLSIFWPGILGISTGIVMAVHSIITVDFWGGESWMTTDLSQRASLIILASHLGIHLLRAYARPAFAVFYRDLRPLVTKEDE